MTEYIPLANAHVTQHTSNNEKTNWSIEKNITDEVLGELPARLNESEIFQILELARKYELEAFNIGINFGKKEQSKINESKLTQLEENLKRVINENARLANALEIITSN